MSKNSRNITRSSSRSGDRSMTWYKTLIAANAQLIGNNYEVFNAFSIKDQLKGMGFRWNGNNKSWFKDKSQITPQGIKQLESLGLNTSALSGTSPAPSPSPIKAPPVAKPAPVSDENSPSCPRCGSRMILRTRRDQSGRQFWGCSQWRFNDPNSCSGFLPYKAPGEDAPKQPGTHQSEPEKKNWYDQNVRLEWTLCEHNGRKLAVATDGEQQVWVDESWKMGDKYNLLTDPVNKILGSDGQSYKSFDPLELFEVDTDENLDDSPAKREPWVPLTDEEKIVRAKGIISPQNITKEQKAIETDFGSGKNITTAALAGTGKTTAIFHLASTFGRPGEDWQYLVFNTKNKVEAKYKAKKCGIEDFFKADSTNGYLGQVIQSKENVGKMPTTKRMVQIESQPKKPVPNRVGLFLDGPEVTQAMKEKYKMVNPEMITKQSLSPQHQDDYVFGAVKSILKSIRYEFKNASKTLCGLGKAYALDPRKGEKELRAGLLKIADNHDIDFELSKIKERIGNYDERFADKVIHELDNILGYDIMEKSMKTEVIETAEYLLNMSLPLASKQTYVHEFKDGRRQSINLGEMRDFDDDLWYAAINADKLKWPRKKVVLADEAQDFNRCQIIALQKLAQAGAQVVIVGDQNQGMYRFRGAEDDALGNMGKLLGTEKDHSLSLNFRSRPAIVNFSNANSCVKNLQRGLRLSDKDIAEFFEKAPTTPTCPEYLKDIQKKFPGPTNGVDVKKWQTACNSGEYEWPPTSLGVVTNEQLDYPGAIASIKKQKDTTGKVRQTALLSPTNAELIPAALDLLGHGIPFVITGTDLAKSLIDHTKDLMVEKRWNAAKRKTEMTQPDPNTPISRFLDKLLRHRDGEVARNGHKAAKADEIKELERITNALETCVHMYNPGTESPNIDHGDIDLNDADEMEVHNKNKPTSIQQSGGTLQGFEKWLKKQLGGLDVDGNERDAEEYMKMQENEDNAPVTLSTVHRSKGLEFSDVYILNYDGLVNPKNVTRKEDIEQWKHAHYVGLTRAKNAQHILRGDED